MLKTGRVPTFLDRLSAELGSPIPDVQSSNIVDIRDPFDKSIYYRGLPEEAARTLFPYFGPDAIKTSQDRGKTLGLEQALGDLTNIANKQQALTRTRLNPSMDLQLGQTDSSQFKQKFVDFLAAKAQRKAR